MLLSAVINVQTGTAISASVFPACRPVLAQWHARCRRAEPVRSHGRQQSWNPFLFDRAGLSRSGHGIVAANGRDRNNARKVCHSATNRVERPTIRKAGPLYPADYYKITYKSWALRVLTTLARHVPKLSPRCEKKRSTLPVPTRQPFRAIDMDGSACRQRAALRNRRLALYRRRQQCQAAGGSGCTWSDSIACAILPAVVPCTKLW